MSKDRENTYLTGLNIKSKSVEKKENIADRYEKDLKEIFLEFLIREKSTFADFNKIENYYKKKLIKCCNKYNENNLIISEKKKLEKQLSNQLKEITINSFVIEEQTDELRENLMNEIKNQIKIKEIELKWYKSLHTRTYKTNYLLSKRLKDELELEITSKEQYEKYKLIKNNVLLSLNNQQEILNQMKYYNDMKIINNNNILYKKEEIYNNLKYQIDSIKKDSFIIEENLKNIIVKKEKTHKEIKEIELIQKKNFKDYLASYNIYHSLKIKLEEIFKFIKMNNIKEIINHYNKERQKYNELNLRANTVNKEISILSTELTKLIQELNNIKNQIIIKMKRKNVFHLNKNFLELKENIDYIKLYIKNLQNSYKTKCNILISILNFCLNSIHKIIKCLKNSSILKYFSFQKKYKNKYQILLNEKKNFSFNLNLQNIDFSVNFIKFVLSIFNNFSVYLFTIQSSSINKSIIVSLENNNFNNLNFNKDFSFKDNQLNKINLTKINNFIILSFDSDKIKNIYEEQIKLSSIRLLNKENIIHRNKEEIERRNSAISQTINKNIQYDIITRNDLLNSFIQYFKTKTKNKFMNRFLNLTKILPYHSMSIMEKYTNEFVDDNIIKEINKKIRFKSIEEKSKIIQYEYNKKEMENFFKKQKHLKHLKKKYLNYLDYTSSSSNEDEKIKENEKYEKMKRLSSQLTKLKTNRNYNLRFEKQEMNDIFNRSKDLKNLERHYYKDKEKYLINQGLFHNIHFNFKKELLSNNSNNSIIKKELISSNNNNSINKIILSKTKSMNSILPHLKKKENLLKKNSRSFRQRPNNYIKLRNYNSSSFFSTKSQDSTNLFILNSKSSLINKSNNKVFDNSELLKPE